MPRTDVKIVTEGSVRLPSIPIHSAGRATFASRGDFVVIDIAGNQCYGRVIGFVRNNEPADKKLYLVVVMITLTGSMWERWVLPEQVIDASYSVCGLYSEKAAWFFGKDFLRTSPDVSRSVGEVTYESIVANFSDEHIPTNEIFKLIK
jgi:hypothetical protein